MWIYDLKNAASKKGISSLLEKNMQDKDFLKKINKLKEEQGESVPIEQKWKQQNL